MAINFDKKAAVVTSGEKHTDLTMKQAEEIALKHAGQNADAVTMLKQKQEMEDGRLVYEVEFYTDTFQKYDYDIDAATGEVLAWDFDGDSAYARLDAILRSQRKDTQKTTANDPLTLEDAKTAALKRANLNDSQVTWGPVYKEHDDGRLIFKGEFYYNTLEYEFEIDAATGRIVDWDVESIYD